MPPIAMLAHLSGGLHTHGEGAAISLVVLGILALCLSWREWV